MVLAYQPVAIITTLLLTQIVAIFIINSIVIPSFDRGIMNAL